MELVLSLLFLCVAVVNCQSVWLENIPKDVSACQKPCVNANQCIADLTCNEGEVIQPNANVCGCCPGCVKPIGENQSCSPGDIPCEKGYECVDKLQNAAVKNYTCQKNPKSCSLTVGTISWTPKCEVDDTFSAVQCKGNDRCFCTAPDGDRIFGFQWIENSENMTCACSRLVWELQQKRKDVSIHCTEGGEFEELQCDNHLCWCADPKTGKPQTRVVPETMVKLLHCYDPNQVGSQYLRQCDSYSVARARIEEAFSQHGTNKLNFDYINCDYDGSYGFKQSDGNTCFCSWKDGSRLGSWATPVGNIDQVNCNCARDTKYMEIDGKGRKAGVCLPNGNYNPAQSLGGSTKFCVDKDGYTIKTDVPITEKCPGE